MTYTVLAAVGVVVALVLDRWVVRTRLTTTRDWWLSYAIIVFFQLLTNGWLTGRGIVQYDPDAILGSDRIVLVGDGRLLYAPVEDLAFGFALVLATCVAWTWYGPRSVDERDDLGEVDA
ncbi:lycopene cyclase domain-containing protein [Nocardioides oleivorans]|uniref:Lycopene cyclase domain-containing protein n=1 Tax=Nocardioides oleivorans TaxID=273676 RepID=A0A4Q2RV28_9ACTN|nr:lycopene cyclase domain-containing protein [Nocardioides oleivorans]RYB91689.1 lycopene cyclase domain-containing protein [Nocardioides oleivorans]